MTGDEVVWISIPCGHTIKASTLIGGIMADHPNLELLRRGYAAYGAGDMDTINELLADDVVWHVAGRSPIAGDYSGKEQVFGLFGKLQG